jgi:phasin
MNAHQSRRLAEDTARTARDTMNKDTAEAEEMTQAVRRGYFAAAKAVGNFNMKLIAMAQGNAIAAFNFAQQVATAKGPSEAVGLCSCYARERFETLTDQSRELTALAQSVMSSTAEPLARSFGQNPWQGFFSVGKKARAHPWSPASFILPMA